MRSNKLNIYLIKQEYGTLADIVETDKDPIEVDGIGTFVFKDSNPYTPGWVRGFFNSTLPSSLHIISSSARGVLIVPIEKDGVTTRFALSFGTGRFLLKEGVIEDRFGLRVVLNSIAPKNWRSIEKTTLGSVPKHSKEQMTRDVKATDFGIDIEQDLVSTITAKSKDEVFGKVITGKDALSLTNKIDITNVKDFLTHCLVRFNSEDYKTDFGWIDQIKDIRDRAQEKRLNELLVAKINDEDFEKIWMAVPEVINWADTQGFKYIRPQRGELHDDLHLPEFLAELGVEEVDIDTLRTKDVYMISAETDDVTDSWSAFKCLYAELDVDGKVYLLNNGKWYEIAKDFTDEVNSHFAHIERSALALPDCETNDEEEYNKKVAETLGGVTCLDRKNIQHGGGHSSVEFCDLITADKQMVYVKKYGGSSLLSHLFAQGTHAGELFVSDTEFRKKANKILPTGLKLASPAKALDAREYEIVYAIISKSKKELSLPFFSKVSLRNADRRLSGYGYKVTLKKIQKVEAPEPSPVVTEAPVSAGA